MKFLESFLRWLAGVIEPSRPPQTDELFKGVTKPTSTLAHLLATEMIRSIEVVPKFELKHKDLAYERRSQIWEFPSVQVTIDLGYTSPSHMYGQKPSKPSFFLMKGATPAFVPQEYDILLEGFETYQKLSEQRQKIQADADNQQKAVDAIANLLGTPKEENTREEA